MFKKDLTIITIVYIISVVIFYGYFWFFVPGKLQYLYQNWDGPNYVVIAKSFYNEKLISQSNTVGLPTTYFANHFPLYPLFIRLFSFVGYYRSMLLVSLIFSYLFLIALYRLIKELKISAKAIWVILPLIFFPARWFIVARVGSSEPVFLFFLVLCLIYFYRKKYFFSALFAALAQLTRAQGILIFAGIMSYYLFQIVRKKKKLTWNLIYQQVLPYLLIPIALLSVFMLFQIQYGDFFAFFHSITQYQHLQFPIYKIFSQIHITTSINVWKEIYIYDYLIYLIPGFLLFRKKLYFPFFVYLFFLLPIPFLVHADVSRYALPLLPFFALGMSDFISHRYFRYSLLITIPAIYAYAINFTLLNLSP